MLNSGLRYSSPEMLKTMPSFKLKFSLGFITFCYVIFSLFMVQAMDIFIHDYITRHNKTKRKL